MAHPLGLQTKRTVEDGFQLYTIVQPRAAIRIPDSMGFEDGVKLPLGILTANAALYNGEHLQLPLPNATPEPTGRTLLVWGGSSNVGIAATQLAVVSGVEVVAVASRKNWDLVRQAGASEIFDQSESEVVVELVARLQKKALIGIFDGEGGLQVLQDDPC